MEHGWDHGQFYKTGLPSSEPGGPFVQLRLPGRDKQFRLLQ